MKAQHSIRKHGIRKHASAWTLALLYAVFQFVLPPTAMADSKTQTVVFDSWVEIPAGVLPAGSYLFRLADSSSGRHRVQIYDKVSGILVADLRTIPQQLEKPVEGSIRLEPRPSPFQGEAVAEWFRPGSRVGEQFIYEPGMPVGEATVAANATELEPVNAAGLTSTPSAPSGESRASTESAAPTASPESSPITQTPETANATRPEQAQTQPTSAEVQSPQQTPPTAAPSPAATAPSDTPADTTGKMPKTASEIPLIAAIGVCSLALAGWFAVLRFRKAVL